MVRNCLRDVWFISVTGVVAKGGVTFLRGEAIAMKVLMESKGGPLKALL